MNWWLVLGVSADASLEDIKSAYLEESRKAHPDFSSGLPESIRSANTRRMKELNRAFEAAKKHVAKRKDSQSQESSQRRASTAHSEGGESQPQRPKKSDPSGSGSNQEVESRKPGASGRGPGSKESIRSRFESRSNWAITGGIVLLFFGIFAASQSQSDNASRSRDGDSAPIANTTADRKSGSSTIALIEPDPGPSITKSTAETVKLDFEPSPNEAVTRSTAPAIRSIPGSGVSKSNALKLSSLPITVSNGKYELWYEGVEGFGSRHLALDFISDGMVYFRDTSGQEFEYSIHSINDRDLEKIIKYVGPAKGNFFSQLPAARIWNMEVAGVPVRGHLAGLLNHFVVIRWEHSREYVLIDFDKLVRSDREYILSFCN